MKKIIYFFLFLFISTLLLNAQGAKRYTLMEHFTNAGCFPCATYNPQFHELYLQNEENAYHIAYHTRGPGYDPMYEINPVEIQNRRDYFDIPGVPSIYLNGNTEAYHPAFISQQDIDDNTSETSPIGIEVKRVNLDQAENTYNISIKTYEDVPTGNWVLRVALVEKNVVYETPPGSNGETTFPNVFRKMLPSVDGEVFEAAPLGETLEYSFSYTPREEWNNANLYAVAFVQNETTKEVLNTGANQFINFSVEHSTSENVIKQTTEGETVFFESSVKMLEKPEGSLQFHLKSDAPEDWASAISVDNIEYSNDFIEVVPEGNEEYNVKIRVTPGESKNISKYVLTISSDNHLISPEGLITFFVNNGVKDIVVDNSDASGWGTLFDEGLAFAENESFSRVSRNLFMDAINMDAITDLENIYFNVGWTFPALTDDFTTILMNQMDSGVNLLIMGQDIAWSIDSDETTHSTPLSSSFLKNYLHATFISDGDGNNSILTPAMEDEDFGQLMDVSIVDFYDGRFYPEQIEPHADSEYATPIFYYNHSDRVGGIKANTGTYKVVYVGIGLEMMGGESDRNNFMKATYDWFHGTTTDIEFDQALSGIAMAQNHPNPSNEFTQIELNNINQPMTFTLIDATGRKVMQQNIEAGTTRVELSTASLQDGIYFYQIQSKNQVFAAKKLVVAH